jgi:hypothetical protein
MLYPVSAVHPDADKKEEDKNRLGSLLSMHFPIMALSIPVSFGCGLSFLFFLSVIWRLH